MTAYLFSCENATCTVPEAYRELFRGSEDIVTSSEGWEPGALNLAQAFAMSFRTPLVHGDVTRLLIELGNDGDERWSRFSMQLTETMRNKLADRHQRPFRTMLSQRVREDLRRYQRVLHVMIHTDAMSDGTVTLETPEGGGGMAEKFAGVWRMRLLAEGLDARLATESRSKALGSWLSHQFPMPQYVRLRLVVSQTFFLAGRPLRWETLKKLLLKSLSQADADMPPLTDPTDLSIAQD